MLNSVPHARYTNRTTEQPVQTDVVSIGVCLSVCVRECVFLLSDNERQNMKHCFVLLIASDARGEDPKVQIVYAEAKYRSVTNPRNAYSRYRLHTIHCSQSEYVCLHKFNGCSYLENKFH